MSAGPISKLLEHLRNKQAVSGEAACSAGTLDAMAGGASGADGLAAHAARALALGAAAEEAARGDAAEARASSAPGKELDLSGQGLMALPAEVWEAGVRLAGSLHPGVPRVPPAVRAVFFLTSVALFPLCTDK